MSKMVHFKRYGNESPYSEGNEGQVLEQSYHIITESTWNDLQVGDLVTSFWTGRMIVPDGTFPKYKDAAGQYAILTNVTEAFVVSALPAIVDRVLNITAADYGYKDDFGTDLPDPS